MASFKDLLKKATNYFRPKTGTLATKGREAYNKFSTTPIAPKWRGAAEVPVSLIKGIGKATTAFTGVDEKIAKKVGFDTYARYQPETKVGKVAEFAGEMAGMLIPASPINQLAKGVAKVPQIASMQKILGKVAGKEIAKGGVKKLLGTGVANVSQGIPYTAAYALAKQSSGEKVGAGDLAKGTATDLALGSIPMVGPLLIGATKALKATKGMDDMLKATKNIETPDMKTILKKIDKGEQALKQGGWGRNKFSPEEMDGIQRAIDEYKVQLGQKPKSPRSPIAKLPANSSTKKLPGMMKEAIDIGQGYEESLMNAQQAQSIRAMLENDQIKDINKLKLVGTKTLANGGDIESLRKKHPDLVESVLSHVRESNPNITDDVEALDFALQLPNKSATVVSKPKGLTALNKSIQQLEELKKAGIDVKTGENGRITSANVEPSPKTMQDILSKGPKVEAKTQELDDAEWQRAVFKQEKAKGGISNPLDVLTKAVKSETNAGASGLKFADDWKGKSRLRLVRETMTRNFEDIMGKDAPAMKAKYLEPIAKSEAERTRWLNKERADVKALGIAPRSAESQLVQDFGEGKLTEVELRTMTANPEKIIKAADVLREKYNAYIKQLNVVLTRNGYDEVPYRKDYFHHFDDLLTQFEVAGPFHKIDTALKTEELPTDINGLTADFKPGRQFFNAILERKGEIATPDAIQGIDKYLEGASNQIFHTDNIKRLRSLEDELRFQYVGDEHLTNFAAELYEFTNNLAGKKSMVDRAAESLVGRKFYAVANAVKSQVGANMVGANVSSALTNYIPLTQTIATTNKQAVAEAMLATIKNTFKDDGFINASDFLTRRKGSDKLTMTKWEKMSKGAGWLFQTVDNFTSQVVTRSKYLEALKQGMPQSKAMAVANDWAARIMADRSKGATPTLFNSKTLGFLTQFQLEVNNQLSFIAKDIPRDSKNWQTAASRIGQVALYGYLFNNIYQSMTGRRPALDPIGVAQRAYEDYTNPNMKEGKATENLVENVTNQLPFTSIVGGGRIPMSAAIPNPFDVIKGESTVGKEVKKLAYLLPPFGGSQVKKTIEGMLAYNKGASTSPSGAVRFPIEQNTENALKTGIFGQWSTEEAQQYLREGKNVLGEKQTERFNQLQKTNPEAAQMYYESIISKREIDNQKKQIKEELKQPKKSWLQTMFAKPVEAAETTTPVDPLDRLVQAEKQRQEKRTLINEVMYGEDYAGMDETQKQQILSQEGVTEDDLAESRLYNMRSLTPSNRAELIMSDSSLDLNQLYKNDVLTPEVAKELERKGYIESADDLIEKMKLTDPYYVRKAQLKSMEKMLKTKADTQKKMIKAQYQGMAQMLKTASKPRRRSSMRRTLKIQKIRQPKFAKPTAYKVKSL